jgi:hypothetical protein
LALERLDPRGRRVEMLLKKLLENFHSKGMLVSTSTNDRRTKDNIERSIPSAAETTDRNHLITVGSMPMLKQP